MTPWVAQLILANVAVFLLSLAIPSAVRDLMLVPALLAIRPWTLITYMFVHGGLMHLFFNMLALYFFGPRLEARLGGRQFLTLYFLSGLTGGLLSLVFSPFAAIVGASGAVFGVLLGFARYWPREPILIWGIVPVEARWLVVIMTVLSLFGGFGFGRSGVAHFAHLGGFLGGYLYLKWLEWRSPAKRFQMETGAITPRRRRSEKEDLERWAKIPREELHEVNREELDRILEKINTTGIASLTLQEREFLDRFSPE